MGNVFRSALSSLIMMIITAGCVSDPPNPSASDRHPANPSAREAPLPPRSTILDPTTAPSEPGSQP